MDFLEPVVGRGEREAPLSALAMTLITLAVVLVGVAIAWWLFRADIPREAPTRVSPVTTFARRDVYGDALNESVLMRPGQWLARLSVYFDNRGIDGLVNSIAAFMGGSSGRLRKVQTGFVRPYALSMFVGAMLLVGVLLLLPLYLR